MARPIFVVGSMGSGTTLMRLMLDSHPHIMIAQETGFMRSVNAIRSIPYWNAKDKWIRRIGVTPAELDRAIEAFYDEVFGLAASKQGATRWGDKTPFHVEFIEELAELFPEAVFVGTIRHPGAVANSVGRFGWTWRKGVRHWCSANEALLEAGVAVGGRLRLWRYEDLVSAPEEVMREVLDFLGEPWDPKVLEHHRHQSGRAEGGTVAHEPVDTQRIDKWAGSASERDLSVLADQAGPMAALFGYDARQSAPVGPLPGASPDGLGTSAQSWSEFGEQIAAIPRRREGRSFENSRYTQNQLAVELGSAYHKGANGGQIRLPYRNMLPVTQGGTKAVAAAKPVPVQQSLASRVRRRMALMISPDA